MTPRIDRKEYFNTQDVTAVTIRDLEEMFASNILDLPDLTIVKDLAPALTDFRQKEEVQESHLENLDGTDNTDKDFIFEKNIKFFTTRGAASDNTPEKIL